MSKIAEAYDALRDELKILFPDKFELVNPNDIEKNPSNTLLDGFGIRVGPARNTNRNTSDCLSVARDMTVILTKQTFTQQLDADSKHEIAVELLEEHFLVIKKYEAEPTLGPNEITNFIFDSDNGIENVVPGEEKYIKIEINYKMEYFEKI